MVCVELNGIRSQYFLATNGVKQGGDLGPTMYCCTMTDCWWNYLMLIMMLFWSTICGCSCFTRPYPSAMRKLLAVCDKYAQEFSIKFNAKITKMSCRWRTRATRCVTQNVLQTNKVDAQCDKLVTELNWQRFASKVAKLPHLHLTYPTCIRWGWPRLSFAEIFSIRKLEFLGYRVALFAWSYV